MKTLSHFILLSIWVAFASASINKLDTTLAERLPDIAGCHRKQGSSAVSRRTLRHRVELPCGARTRPKKFRTSQFSARLFEGHQSKPGEFPFLVGIVRTTGSNKDGGNNGSLYGAGVIIDTGHILTCAHLFKTPQMDLKPRSVKVRLGEYSISEPDGETIADISDIFVHEDFKLDDTMATNNYRYLNDIALLRTKQPIKFKLTPDGFGSINRICLPDKNADYRQGEEKFGIAGWGRTEYANYEDTIQRARVEHIEDSRCAERWSNLPEKYKNHQIKLDMERQICAAGSQDLSNERGYCDGDSGGPLVRLNSAGNQELAGIISMWPFDCINFAPSIFTRVSYYLDWIASKVQT